MIASWLDRLAGIVGLRRVGDDAHPGASRVPYVRRTVAGEIITPDTAVTIPAVWACLRYLSQTVAGLPWRVMRDTDRGGEVATTHPVHWLIARRPSDEWSSFQFRETLTHWALRWGNGYAEIERDAIGRPIGLHPLHPARVTVERDAAGRLVYVVDDGSNGRVMLAAADVFHIRGFGEGPVGVDVIQYAAQSLGWARAAQIFGAAFFGNGANLGGVVSMKRALSEDGLAEAKKQFAALYQGGRNASKTAFLDAEMSYQPIGVDPDKAQFILTHQHLVEEVCRWFGVPPHKVMHLLRGTFSNIEHQSIEVVVDSITPWAKRFEDEADWKLFGRQNRNGYYTKMNFNALMRGDAKSRGEWYKMMREVGAFTVNRILQLEDENTIGPDGDKHVMQSQYTTLERIGEAPEPAAAVPPPADGAAGVSDDAADAPDDDEEIAAMAAIERMAGALVDG